METFSTLGYSSVFSNQAHYTTRQTWHTIHEWYCLKDKRASPPLTSITAGTFFFLFLCIATRDGSRRTRELGGNFRSVTLWLKKSWNKAQQWEDGERNGGMEETKKVIVKKKLPAAKTAVFKVAVWRWGGGRENFLVGTRLTKWGPTCWSSLCQTIECSVEMPSRCVCNLRNLTRIVHLPSLETF